MENVSAILAGKGETAVCGMTNVKYLTVMVMVNAPMVSAFAFAVLKENSAKKVKYHIVLFVFFYQLNSVIYSNLLFIVDVDFSNI